MEAETLGLGGEGNTDALAEIVNILEAGSKTRSDEQRPSMAQDIAKGRRTETDFINGFIAERGREIGVPADVHARVNEIVKKVERGEIKPSVENVAGV
jgi:2-dehydropantoate 2-reductase